MKRLKTLRARVALWTAGLLLTTLVLFGLFVYAAMAYSLYAAGDETLHLTAMQLMAEVEVKGGELTFIETPLDDPQYARLREKDFSMRAFNLGGQPVQAYGPYRALPPPSIDLTRLEQPGVFSSMVDPDSQSLVRIYTTPVVINQRVVGVLQVALNRTDISRTLDLLRLSLLFGGLLLVLVAGGSGYFLAGRALAPIDTIIRTARRISAGDLTARLNLPERADEVGLLASTFDSMLGRLDDSFQRERQFTADAAHELRTPLSAMQTIIGSTVAQQRAPAAYEQALHDLSGEVGHMRALSEQLLHLARHETAQQLARFEEVELTILLRDVVDSLRPLAERKGLKLIDNLPLESLTLMGDGDGLIRLFVNLIDNAIKYTEQGYITVSVRAHQADLLEIAISDTGPGIAPEHLPYIFDRFYRVDDARSKDGIGLGLAIALNIAQAHKGSILVESTLGAGAMFIVQLSSV